MKKNYSTTFGNITLNTLVNSINLYFTVGIFRSKTVNHNPVKYLFAFFFALGLVAPNITYAQDRTGKILNESFIWTTANNGGTNNIHAVFRKSFERSQKPQWGILNLFAYNRFEVYVNGTYIMRGPVRFENKRPQYASINIAPYLRAGKNVITVIVHRNSHTGRIMDHPAGFTAQVEIGSKNGAIDRFKTDETWRTTPELSFLPTRDVWGSIYDNIDARKMPSHYTKLDFDDHNWPGAVKLNTTGWSDLHKQELPFQQETLLSGITINEKPFKENITLNTGENIKVKLPRFTQAYIKMSFEADESTEFTVFNNKYIARKGLQEYSTSDTHGLKEFDVKVKSGHINIKNIEVVQRIYPFERLGSFNSNDPLLNQIWEICTYSLQILSEDAYVDCADRERVEWMDEDPPAFDVTRIAMAGPDQDGKKTYADGRLMKEMLRRTALTQQDDGRVKAHTCSDRWDIHAIMEDRACDWVEGTRRYYESTGDTALIREIWKPIYLQMQWFLKQRTARGLVKAREWVVWGNPMGYQTCEGAGLNAFVYKALVDAAYLGNVIGDNQKATELATAADQLKAAFNLHLWDKKLGSYYAGGLESDSLNRKPIMGRVNKLNVVDGKVEPTFHAALFALDQGIVPQQRLDSVERFLEKNNEGNYEIMTYYYLFKQMYSKNNPSSDAEVLNMIRKKWKDMADDEMQMTWEGFDKKGNKAHIYGMFPAWFLSAYALGVRVDGPVWDKKILIKPQLGDLTSVNGTVVTEFGLVPVSWKKENSKLNFTIIIPEGASATLELDVNEGKKLMINSKYMSNIIKNNQISVNLKSGKYTGVLSR